MIPHPHKELIKKWADGYTIQTKEHFGWVDCSTPLWWKDTDYRLKPCSFTQSLIDAYKRGDKVKYSSVANYAAPWYCLHFVNPEDIETYNFDILNYSWSIEPVESDYEDPTADINEILDEFDFERVNEVMKSIYWQWVMPDGGYRTPSIPELRKHARKLLEETISGLISSNESDYCVECGGFRAEADKYENNPKIYIKLSFVLTSWENVY